jgi:hypothetical protein
MSYIKNSNAYYIPFTRATFIQRVHYTLRHFRAAGIKNAWADSYYLFEE